MTLSKQPERWSSLWVLLNSFQREFRFVWFRVVSFGFVWFVIFAPICSNNDLHKNEAALVV